MSECNKWPGCGYCKECDNVEQLRRRVETLTKARDNALDYSHRYKKALDDLVDLKEKQYTKIEELESQNAAMRGMIDDAITKIGLTANELNFIVKNFDSYDVKGYLEAMASDLNDRASGLTQALTASGENRYARIEEAAKEVVDSLGQHAGKTVAVSYSAVRELAAALGEGE